ncbi:MAG: endonuclease III [Candidatus Algichlamydia australiensis]|nr:endonuclease III [Chlamydiales bacterium]
MKVEEILTILDHYFPNPKVSLDHRDSYTLLIATLLSAQCTDKRVNEITPLLFARAKTPEEMIQLKVDEIEEIIRPCGLGPTKAKNIWALSKILIEEYGSEVPGSLEEMEKLPGVGHKTASVVLTQAFNLPAFPVDTHIHRLAKRWNLSSGKNVRQTEKDLKEHFPKERWCKVHLQMIYFARQFCPAKKHQKSLCPICKVISQEC